MLHSLSPMQISHRQAPRQARPPTTSLISCQQRSREQQVSSAQTQRVPLMLTAAAVVACIVAPVSHAGDTHDRAGGVKTEESPLIQELLQRSKENKAKYDKERLDSYNRRNFSEYFQYVEGNIQRGVDEGYSDATKEKIKKWVEENSPERLKKASKQ